jgi:hypothetical protein
MSDEFFAQRRPAVEIKQALSSAKNHKMASPQSTIEEITESERQMLLAAESRYGKYYTNARTISVFLSQCIAGVNHDRMMFGRFLTLISTTCLRCFRLFDCIRSKR